MSRVAPPSMMPACRAYITGKIGLLCPVETTEVVGFLDRNGAVSGVWMFERYTGEGGSLYAHWGGEPGWLSRGMLEAIGFYVFGQLKVAKVFAEVRRSDAYARKVAEKMGYQKVAIIPGYFPDGDLVIYSMSKQQYRWLPKVFTENPNGQEV